MDFALGAERWELGAARALGDYIHTQGYLDTLIPSLIEIGRRDYNAAKVLLVMAPSSGLDLRHHTGHCMVHYGIILVID